MKNERLLLRDDVGEQRKNFRGDFAFWNHDEKILQHVRFAPGIGAPLAVARAMMEKLCFVQDMPANCFATSNSVLRAEINSNGTFRKQIIAQRDARKGRKTILRRKKDLIRFNSRKTIDYRTFARARFGSFVMGCSLARS